MARRQRVHVEDVMAAAVEEQRQQEHSLAALARREDRQVDNAIAERMFVGPMVAWATERARGVSPAKAKDDGPTPWRWPNEIAVVRAVATRGDAHASVRGVGGNLGRMIDRKALGGGSAPTSTRAYEPSYDEHQHAAFVVWQTLTKRERELLEVMHVQIASQGDGGAASVAPKVRELEREGAIAGAFELLAPLKVRPGQLELARVKPMLLLAIAVEHLEIDAGEDRRKVVTSLVAKDLGRARDAFRDRLRAVDLSDANHRERQHLLVPPASLEDLGREVEVVVCIGAIAAEPIAHGTDVIAAIVAGERPHCDHARLVADASSWPSCDACGRPRMQGARP